MFKKSQDTLTLCWLKHVFLRIVLNQFREKLINVNTDEDGPEETDWEEIHLRNFKCCIETKLRSFYFKICHKAIAFNDFLFKINRKDSDCCDFCKKFPETIIHVFCESDFMLNLFGMILLKLLKISMTLIFLFQTLKRCLEFSRTISLHIYFFVWNTIFMYVNVEVRNLHLGLLGTQLYQE